MYKCDKVTEDGLKFLINLPHLQQLSLCFFSQLSEVGINYICQIKALKHLILWGDGMSRKNKTIRKIKQIRPDLRITDGVFRGDFNEKILANEKKLEKLKRKHWILKKELTEGIKE